MAADLTYSENADDLPEAFFAELASTCRELGCDPLDMLTVMMAESAARPGAQHKSTKASGLILFTPATLAALGWSRGPDAYAGLPAVDQLRYVRRYFLPYARHGLGSAGRLYQATFLPATLSHGSAPETVVCAEEGPFADAYATNSGLDADSDGAITVADLTTRLLAARRGPRWDALAARLAVTSRQPDDPRRRP